VALVAAVGDDELGDRIVDFVAACGIDTAYVRRRAAPNGVCFAGRARARGAARRARDAVVSRRHARAARHRLAA
jgi:sugar/nucleoside kinase (ribokinase family)